jgi:hypothetical protein
MKQRETLGWHGWQLATLNGAVAISGSRALFDISLATITLNGAGIMHAALKGSTWNPYDLA